MNWLIIGSENDPRVQGFQNTLKSTGVARIRVVGYQDDWAELLPQLLTPSTCLRIEAPNQISDVRYLMKRGFAAARSNKLDALLDQAVDNADLENGEFFAPHQFYYGLKDKLELLHALIQTHPILASMNHIADILNFFDKQHCHQTLSRAKVLVPKGLYDVSCYDDLREKMHLAGHKNVFIKTRFGSGASGIVALKTNGAFKTSSAYKTSGAYKASSGLKKNKARLQSLTTVEQHNGRLYNTRRLQKCSNESDVANLIDRLCKWGVHCESWVPKAVVNKKESDCRILLINGKADFFVLRKSNTPITNLHLMNERANIHELTDAMTDNAWDNVLTTCDKIAAIYPRSFNLAADIAVHKNLREHCVLELNAFGDFLHNIQHKGMNTHAWQLEQFKVKHDRAYADAL